MGSQFSSFWTSCSFCAVPCLCQFCIPSFPDYTSDPTKWRQVSKSAKRSRIVSTKSSARKTSVTSFSISRMRKLFALKKPAPVMRATRPFWGTSWHAAPRTVGTGCSTSNTGISARAQTKSLKKKLLLMTWCPDTAKIKKKMLYSSSFDALKKCLVGSITYIQATDEAEASIEQVEEKLRAHDRT